MQTIIDGKTYLSRPRVLLDFFEKSRGKWKRKCKQAKMELKLLKNQNRAVETSRARWRTQTKQLEAEVQRLRNELQEQKCRRA